MTEGFSNGGEAAEFCAPKGNVTPDFGRSVMGKEPSSGRSSSQSKLRVKDLSSSAGIADFRGSW